MTCINLRENTNTQSPNNRSTVYYTLLLIGQINKLSRSWFQVWFAMLNFNVQVCVCAYKLYLVFNNYHHNYKKCVIPFEITEYFH